MASLGLREDLGQEIAGRGCKEKLVTTDLAITREVVGSLVNLYLLLLSVDCLFFRGRISFLGLSSLMGFSVTHKWSALHYTQVRMSNIIWI